MATANIVKWMELALQLGLCVPFDDGVAVVGGVDAVAIVGDDDAVVVGGDGVGYQILTLAMDRVHIVRN